MYFIGVLIFAIAIMLATAVSININALLNLQSIFVLTAAIISTLVATGSLKDFIFGLKVLLKSDTEIEIEQLQACIELHKLLFKVTLASGVIGWLVANISIVNAHDPSIIILVMARSLLPILYSLIISFIFILPAQYLLIKKYNFMTKNK